MAFSFLQKNEGSWNDTLLTAHFERAILITARQDEPLPRSQQRRAAMITRAPLQLLLACLEGKIRLLPFATVINVGCKSFSPVSDFKMVRIMRCTIYRNGVFSAFILFPPSQKGAACWSRAALFCVIYLFFAQKRVDTHINVGV